MDEGTVRLPSFYRGESIDFVCNGGLHGFM